MLGSGAASLGASEAAPRRSCLTFLPCFALTAVQSQGERMGQRQLFRQQQQQQWWQQRLPKEKQRRGLGSRVHAEEQEVLPGRCAEWGTAEQHGWGCPSACDHQEAAGSPLRRSSAHGSLLCLSLEPRGQLKMPFLSSKAFVQHCRSRPVLLLALLPSLNSSFLPGGSVLFLRSCW